MALEVVFDVAGEIVVLLAEECCALDVDEVENTSILAFLIKAFTCLRGLDDSDFDFVDCDDSFSLFSAMGGILGTECFLSVSFTSCVITVFSSTGVVVEDVAAESGETAIASLQGTGGQEDALLLSSRISS